MIVWPCVAVCRETYPPSWRHSSSSPGPGSTAIVRVTWPGHCVDASPTCALPRQGSRLEHRKGPPRGMVAPASSRVEPFAGRGVGERDLLESRMDHRLDEALR